MAKKRDESTSVGYAIMRARRGANLTARELAHELGVSTKTITRWENDETAPNFEQRDAILQTLAASPRELLQRLAAKLRLTLSTAAVAATPMPASATVPSTTPSIASPTHAHSDVRLAFDDVVLAGAEELDVSPRRLRAVMGDLLREMERLAVPLRTARDALAPLRKAPTKLGAR